MVTFTRVPSGGKDFALRIPSAEMIFSFSVASGEKFYFNSYGLTSRGIVFL